MGSEELEEAGRWGMREVVKVIEKGQFKEAWVKGQRTISWKIGDELGERMAIVQISEMELIGQEELGNVFQIHENTVSNYVRAYREKGSEGLRSGDRGPKKSWKIVPEVRLKILWLVLKERVKEYKKIQEGLKKRWDMEVSIASIWQVLMENGLVKKREGMDDFLVKSLFHPTERNHIIFYLPMI